MECSRISMREIEAIETNTGNPQHNMGHRRWKRGCASEHQVYTEAVEEYKIEDLNQ